MTRKKSRGHKKETTLPIARSKIPDAKGIVKTCIKKSNLIICNCLDKIALDCFGFRIKDCKNACKKNEEYIKD